MDTRQDPSDIHPEHDQPTPENIDDWSGDQIDAYNEAKERELEEEVQENERELSRKQREMLSTIESATNNDSQVPTAKIEFGDATLEVRRKLTGELESKFDTIAKNEDNLGQIRDCLIDVCTMLIVDDDEPDDDEYDFTDRGTWEAYYDRHGQEGMIDAFNILSEPAMQRRDNLQFRGTE